MARIKGTARNDILFGTSKDDVIEGLDGADILVGGAGNDELLGGDGGDTLIGGLGRDILDGGAGDDTLAADATDQAVLGGDGQDYATFNFSRATTGLTFSVAENLAGTVTVAGTMQVSGVEQISFTGGTGADRLTGGALADSLSGGAGNDILTGGLGDDTLDGGTGDDTLFATSGRDLLRGGAGNDFLHAGSGSELDILDGGAGIDTAFVDRSDATTNITFDLRVPGRAQTLDNGTSLANVEQIQLWSGAGDDRLTGGARNDHFSGGAGADRLDGAGGDDFMSGDAQDISILGGAGTDLGYFNMRALTQGLNFSVQANLAATVKLGQTDVSGFEQVYILGGSGNDSLIGGDLADDFKGGMGADILQGGAGDDLLFGEEGNDTLFAGSGNDHLRGGEGDDLLLAGLDNGTDYLDGGDGVDRAVVDYDHLTTNVDFNLQHPAQPQTIGGLTLVNVERVTLYTGSGDDSLRGGELDDFLHGGDGRDILIGEGGGDVLNGGQGDDLVIVDAQDYGAVGGAGTDFGYFDLRTITEDMGFSVQGNLAGMARLGNTDVQGFEQVFIRSGSGNDTLTGGGLRDDLYGGAGKDILDGGAGDDQIFGEDGNDTLFAGSGNDNLVGGDGDDLLLIGQGGGTDGLDGGAGIDRAVIDFGGVTTSNIDFNLQHPATAQTIEGLTLVNVERVTLYTGSGDDSLRGGELDDFLHGGDGRDVLIGDGGGDVLNGGQGDDLVVADAQDYGAIGGAGTDLGYFDVRSITEDMSFSVQGNLAGMARLGNTDVEGFEQVFVRSGSGNDTLTGGGLRDDLYGGAGKDILDGGEGDDQIFGEDGDDTLHAGSGNDNLVGGDGDDLLLIGRGGGTDGLDGGAGIDRAVIDYGDISENVVFSLQDPAVAQTIEGLTLVNVERVTLYTGSGNDQLHGGAHEDFLHGGDGIDVISGGGAGDWLNGGQGDDLVAGDSQDYVIDGGAGTDLGFLDMRNITQDMSFSVQGNLAGTVKLGQTDVSGFEQVYMYGGSGNDTLTGGGLNDDFRGGAGKDALNGEAGDDRLFGEDGNDTLSAGSGNDSLFGGDGEDLLHAGLGGGVDQLDGGAGSDRAIIDYDHVTTNVTFDLKDPAVAQTIEGLTLVNVERVTLYTGSGDDQLHGGSLDDFLHGGDGRDIISGGGGADWLGGGLGDDFMAGDAEDISIHGGAGTDWGIFDMRAVADDMTFSVAANLAGSTVLGQTNVSGFEQVFIRGGSGADTLTGGDRDDDLYGGAGDDLLVGGGGTDILKGDGGQDRITGGAGNDRVEGGDGIDIVVFSGVRADYQLVQLPDGWVQVTDLRAGGPDGVDKVIQVERFAFADGELSFSDALGINIAPVAVGDQASASEDGSISIAVLANDTDANVGDSQTLVSVNTAGALGQASINLDGTVSYSAGAAFQHLAAGQTSTDTFTYTMRDAAGLTSTASVTVQIIGQNDAPIAVADTGSVGEDGLVILNLLANDSDPDAGATLVLSSMNFTGTLGTAYFNPDGTVTYDPRDAFQHLAAGETATDSFTYSVRDNQGGLSVQTVTITINGADEPPPPVGPVAHNDTLAFASNQGAALVTGLLANDEGQGLVLASAQQHTPGGAVVTVIDGQLVYDPGDRFIGLAPGQTATDTITYTVRDANGLTSTATAQVTITGAAGPETLFYLEEDATTANLHDLVLEAAMEAYGPGLTLTGVNTATTVGQVAFDAAADSLTYTAAHPWLDRLVGDSHPPLTSFTYTVTGQNGVTHTGTVVLAITGVTDAPIATSDFQQVDEGSVTGNLWSKVLANDSDPEGHSFTIVSVDTSGTVGQVVFDPVSHTLTYQAGDHDAYATGKDSFTYTVRDSSGLESTATVTLAILETSAAAFFAPPAADLLVFSAEDQTDEGAGQASDPASSWEGGAEPAGFEAWTFDADLPLAQVTDHFAAPTADWFLA